MSFLTKIWKWLFVPTKEELPEACKPVYEELEKRVIPPHLDHQFLLPEEVHPITIGPTIEKSGIFQLKIEGNTLKKAQEYAQDLITTSNTTTVEKVEEYIKSTQEEVKPSKKRKTTNDIKFFDPKDNIKLDEEKANQIKKSRKPRKKNGNK